MPEFFEGREENEFPLHFRGVGHPSTQQHRPKISDKVLNYSRTPSTTSLPDRYEVTTP